MHARDWKSRLFPALVAAACFSLSAAEFFVAPDGSDANSGTRSHPFATLEAARNAIRAHRSSSRPREPFNVWLRGGDYLRTNALELAGEDGGVPGAPVVWAAWRGESARLLGGRRLTGFTAVTNPAVLARLPEAARGRVLECDLHRLGLTQFGEMHSRGFGRPAAVAHCELFYNGRPMTLARWPNEGEFATIQGYPSSGASKDEHGGTLGKLEEGFTYEGDRPSGWKNPSEVWVHGYWAWDWANSYERVAELDPARRLVKTAAPFGQYGFRKGQRFYFLNVLEELDQPGEWHLDRQGARLYFWPPGALEEKAGNEVLLSTLGEPLIRITGVTNLVVRGLVLEAGRASGIEMKGGADDRIEGCVLRNLGNNGVTIEGGVENTVASCDVFDTGDGGVSLNGGDRQTLVPGNHVVDNCHFARQGRWSKCYVPAILLQGAGLRASHNLIEDHPHCGILFWGNDHLIEYNEIRRVALETGDVGAIYTGRDYTFRGNRIRYNFIHDIGGVGMGSMGVYADDCVSGLYIAGNLFHRVQRAAFLGGGRDHQVLNNVFVDCNHAVELDGRGLDATPVWRNMVDDTMRKSLAAMPADLYRERYPLLTTLDAYYGPPGGPALTGAAFKGVPPEGNVVERNVCVGKWLNVYWHAAPGMLRLEGNLTNASSSFLRPLPDQPRPCDFALRKDSPAFALGFHAIPCEEIGLQPDALRGALASRRPQGRP